MLLQRFRRMEVFGRRDFLRGDVAQKRAHRGILPIRRKSGRGGVEFLTSRITAVFFLTHTFSHLEAEQKVLSQAQGAVFTGDGGRLDAASCEASKNRRSVPAVIQQLIRLEQRRQANAVVRARAPQLLQTFAIVEAG